MNHCSRCGVESADGAKFCASCGGPLQPAPLVPPVELTSTQYPAMRGMAPVVPPQPEPHYAAMRGMAPAPSPHGEEHFAAMRGMATMPVDTPAFAGPAQPRFASGKNPWRSFALSMFFPGGGQFYNGDSKKGFTVLALAILAFLLMLLRPLWFVGALLSMGSWLWALMDARSVALGRKAMW